ncbi:SAM-dependent methyltransferase [Kitasatospora griseola]|uniref:SAM-dependent methyltransferase n=1 Tax=Kitasatospora griseola TaxID=2064 RepID=UPI00343FF6E6
MTPTAPQLPAPLRPDAVVPEALQRTSFADRAAPSRVELVLAGHPAPHVPDVFRRDRVAASAIHQVCPGLPVAVRNAAAAEEAAVRAAVRGGRQVLHIGYGLGVPFREPHGWWRRTSEQHPHVVAVTSCDHAYARAGLLCEDPVRLIFEPEERLHLLLDHPHLAGLIDLARPVDVVLAGTHRTSRTAVEGLLDRLLGELAPGSTLALIGLAVEDGAARRSLRVRWTHYTGQRPAVLHHKGAGGLISRLRGFEQRALLAPPHQAPPDVHAYAAAHCIGTATGRGAS